MKTIFSRILGFLLTPIALLWRRHERQVLGECTGIEGIPAEVTEKVRRDINRLTREAFLGGVHPEGKIPAPLDPEKMARIANSLDLQRRQMLHMIVITKYAPLSGFLKAKYKGDWYLLARRINWEFLKTAVERDVPWHNDSCWLSLFPLGSLNGIPVVEDDELAREILLSSLTGTGQRARWN